MNYPIILYFAYLFTFSLTVQCFHVSLIMFGNGGTYLQIYPFNAADEFIVFKFRDRVIQIDSGADQVSTHRNTTIFRSYIGNFLEWKDSKEMCVIILPTNNNIIHTTWRIFESDYLRNFDLPDVLEYPKVLRLEDHQQAIHEHVDEELVEDEEFEKCITELDEKEEWRLDPKMRKANLAMLSETQKVFVTLTTSPSRLQSLHYVLASLDLSLVDNIFVILPHKFKGRESYKITSELKKEFPLLVYLSESTDYGPISKIASSVQYVYENYEKGVADESVFISIDDDQRYSDRTIDTLLYFSLVNEDSAITVSTPTYLPTGTFGLPFIEDKPLFGGHSERRSELEGFAGVAYRGKHVDYKLMKHFTDYSKNPQLFTCYLSDDVVIAAVLLLRDVQIIELDNNMKKTFYSKSERKDFPNFKDSNALQFTGPEGTRQMLRAHYDKYVKCHVLLISHILDDNLKYKTIPVY